MAESVNISYSSSPSAGGTISVGSGVPYPGNLKSFVASPSEGYRFDRWWCSSGEFVDYLAYNTQFLIPNEDVVIIAYFNPISDSSSGGGRYNGTSWDGVEPYYYDGTNWVPCSFERYNGADWVNVDTN